MRRRLALLILALSIAGGVVVGCGHARPQSERELIGYKHDDISMYYSTIIDLRMQAGLPGISPSRRWFGVDPTKVPPRPRAAARCDKCDDACDLADRICAAADEICDIARELPGDEWAKDKCLSANASCAEAQNKCSKCVCTPADTEASVSPTSSRCDAVF